MNAVKQMAFYGVSTGLCKVLSILMLPIITQQLSLAEYGQLNMLVAFSSVASLLLSMSVSNMLFRYASNASLSDPNNHNLFNGLFKLSLIGASALLMLCVVWLDEISQLLPVMVKPIDLLLLCINLAAATLMTIPLAWLRIANRAKTYAGVLLAQAVLQAGLILYSVHTGLTVTAVVLAGAIASSLSCLYLIALFFRNIDRHPIQLNRNQWLFMVSILLSALCLYGLNGAEHWLIAEYFGAAQLAIYFIAAQLGLLLAFSIEPFKLWWFAKRFQIINQHNGDGKVYSAQVCEIAVQLSILLASLALIITPWFVERFLVADYHGVNQLLFIPVLIFWFRVYAEFFNLGCYQQHNGYWAPSINSFCLSILLLLVTVLVEPFGFFALAFSLIIAHTLRALIFIVISQQLVYLPYNWLRLLPVQISGWLIVTWQYLHASGLLTSYAPAIALFIFNLFWLCFGIGLLRNPILNYVNQRLTKANKVTRLNRFFSLQDKG